MATAEEKLLGYQIIDKAHLGNEIVRGASYNARGLRVGTSTPLTVNIGTITNPVWGEPTVSHLQQFLVTSCDCIDLEVGNRLNQFLARFLDTDKIAAGLAHIGIPRAKVDTDRNATSTTSTTLRPIIPTLNTAKKLSDRGVLLGQYSPAVIKNFDFYDVITPAEHRYLDVWDLLNAMMFELRGLNSHNGVAQYSDPVAIKKLVESRILCARNTGNVDSHFTAVLDYVAGELQALTTLAEFSQLADYIDSQVPRLALLRRWWQHA